MHGRPTAAAVAGTSDENTADSSAGTARGKDSWTTQALNAVAAVISPENTGNEAPHPPPVPVAAAAAGFRSNHKGITPPAAAADDNFISSSSNTSSRPRPSPCFSCRSCYLQHLLIFLVLIQAAAIAAAAAVAGSVAGLDGSSSSSGAAGVVAAITAADATAAGYLLQPGVLQELLPLQGGEGVATAAMAAAAAVAAAMAAAGGGSSAGDSKQQEQEGGEQGLGVEGEQGLNPITAGGSSSSSGGVMGADYPDVGRNQMTLQLRAAAAAGAGGGGGGRAKEDEKLLMHLLGASKGFIPQDPGESGSGRYSRNLLLQQQQQQHGVRRHKRASSSSSNSQGLVDDTPSGRSAEPHGQGGARVLRSGARALGFRASRRAASAAAGGGGVGVRRSSVGGSAAAAGGGGSVWSRSRVLLFGDSITELSFQPGGWGAMLAAHYTRRVSWE